MKLELVYVAHPVGAPDAYGIASNLANASTWAAWLKARDSIEVGS